MRRAHGPTRALVLVLALVLLACAPPAAGEVTQKAGLRVAVAAKIAPTRLPRSGTAPVAVSLVARFAATDGGVPPALHGLRIELNRDGRLDTAGLPECSIGEIQPASSAQALAACRPALVGQGSFSVDVVLGTQQPYPTRGRLLVFNGRLGGRPALLGQIYAPRPFANSFVIPFRIESPRHGTFGVALSAILPPSFTRWGHFTALRLRLGSHRRKGGPKPSIISAGCPAPKGFPGAVFPLARTHFSFSGSIELGQTLTGRCKARGTRAGLESSSARFFAGRGAGRSSASPVRTASSTRACPSDLARSREEAIRICDASRCTFDLRRSRTAEAAAQLRLCDDVRSKE